MFWLIELRVLGPRRIRKSGAAAWFWAELPGCCRSRLATGKCPRTVDVPG